ncbi:hypothetical protein B0T17DRAFT_619410 [Bombardia bombarda]|uniref:Uncharacterized protein n=1 Tax=Bombardia bombarda TaxID=252184 RepID=A0AA40BW39_9PEZI|nr:hypothetical protein B0T17DRAFT_619410 [Bombardia bombarda]
MDSNQGIQQEKKPTQGADGGRLHDLGKDVKAKFEAHTATPGPAIPQNFNIQEEGTKEERRAKTEELNKNN